MWLKNPRSFGPVPAPIGSRNPVVASSHSDMNGLHQPLFRPPSGPTGFSYSPGSCLGLLASPAQPALMLPRSPVSPYSSTSLARVTMKSSVRLSKDSCSLFYLPHKVMELSLQGPPVQVLADLPLKALLRGHWHLVNQTRAVKGKMPCW